MATDVSHRYDRTGERVEHDDPTPAPRRPVDHDEDRRQPPRCNRGWLVAADGTCCIKHDVGMISRR
jgi:hypothetical protein